jgi:hypothetical protein
MECVIFDIDGTLADLRHRLHHVTGAHKNWDMFFATVHLDTPITPVVTLAKIVDYYEMPIICVSGRPEDIRDQTSQWLHDQDIWPADLYMRPSNDYRPDYVIKKELLVKLREDGWEPILVIDDRPSVVQMWRAEGLVCLQTAPEEKEHVPPGTTLTLMVAPSGSGKSTWVQSEAAKALGVYPDHVISIDDIRRDLCGDFRDQSRNFEAHEAGKKVALARLRCGLPTVIDATNLRNKDRKEMAQLVPLTSPVRYIVLNRSIEDKRKTGGWRNELVKPDGTLFDLIAKHDQTFRANLKEILRGDGLPNVTVYDYREDKS